MAFLNSLRGATLDKKINKKGEIEKYGHYIAYNAGCGIWEAEPFDKNIDWHNEVYKGTKSQCEQKVLSEMTKDHRRYPNAREGSIHDY